MTTAHHAKEDPRIQVPPPQAKSAEETCNLTGRKRQMELSDGATKRNELPRNEEMPSPWHPVCCSSLSVQE